MSLTRRALLTGLSAAIVAPAVANDRWPTRPITLIVGFPPGGPVDSVSRILAEALSNVLGQKVIIENKPGATGTMAVAQVARATPDGYTLLALPSTHAATAATFRSLPYHPIDDLTLIGMTCENPVVLVTHAQHRIRNIADLFERAKSTETPLQYGTAGNGSLQHLSMELLAMQAGIRLQHIPYRGGAPAITDLLGRRIDLVLDPPTALMEHIGSGTLRALAVTSPTRFFGLPDVPTLLEFGLKNYAVTSWQGLASPAGLPLTTVTALNAAIADVTADVAVTRRLKVLGVTPRHAGAGDLKARLTADLNTWKKVVEVAHIEKI